MGCPSVRDLTTPFNGPVRSRIAAGSITNPTSYMSAVLI
jgi:hypothetical protein